MLQSKTEKPCFYLTARADITDIMKLRPKLRKATGIKITTSAFYIYAISRAVEDFPMVIGRIHGNTIKIPDAINIGFAVNAPQGLVVPVLKKADLKTLPQIAKEEKQLINKARDNDLTLEDMENETIAVSNLGAYDVDSFIPIVPPQATSIIAIGNVLRQIIPIDSEPQQRRTVSFTLATDHRFVNGIYAAEFLESFVKMLENPRRIIENLS
jgi:pyruvate dehydrogenase E2 component (dihydrolipoamide acetyltransferase)